MIGWIYFLGYLWFFRYTVGYLVEFATSEYSRDVGDYVMGCFLSLFVTLAWPLLVTGRIAYVIAKKMSKGDELPTEIFFPGPKPVETRGQKQARIAEEKKHALIARQQEINARERELDMELTRWTNATR